MFIEAQDI